MIRPPTTINSKEVADVLNLDHTEATADNNNSNIMIGLMRSIDSSAMTRTESIKA